MTILLVLLLGVLIGGLASHRLFTAALTSTSRRSIKQLEDTLEGLAVAHRIELATLEAEGEFDTRPQLYSPRLPEPPADRQPQ
jgi:hypothetical protein